MPLAEPHGPSLNRRRKRAAPNRVPRWPHRRLQSVAVSPGSAASRRRRRRSRVAVLSSATEFSRVGLQRRVDGNLDLARPVCTPPLRAQPRLGDPQLPFLQRYASFLLHAVWSSGDAAPRRGVATHPVLGGRRQPPAPARARAGTDRAQCAVAVLDGRVPDGRGPARRLDPGPRLLRGGVRPRGCGMTSPQMTTLDEHLQRLRLNTVRARLEALLQEASANGLSHAEFLDQLLSEEVEAKTAKHVTRRTGTGRSRLRACRAGRNGRRRPRAPCRGGALGAWFRGAERRIRLPHSGSAKTKSAFPPSGW